MQARDWYLLPDQHGIRLNVMGLNHPEVGSQCQKGWRPLVEHKRRMTGRTDLLASLSSKLRLRRKKRILELCLQNY